MRLPRSSLLAVYKNWRSFVLSAFLALLLSACTFPTLSVPDTLALPDEQLAILKNRWGCPFCVTGIYRDKDGTALYEKGEDNLTDSFRLIPGRYVIAYSSSLHKIPEVSRLDTVELKSGHVYRVESKFCYVLDMLWDWSCWGHAYQMTIWIEDLATGEVMASEKW